uniref:Putative secreted peptide n=1 Tax=Anopheles braziliensis TaxID=58242 RepID=A0A2M3ZUB7_9DIPT
MLLHEPKPAFTIALSLCLIPPFTLSSHFGPDKPNHPSTNNEAHCHQNKSFEEPDLCCTRPTAVLHTVLGR